MLSPEQRDFFITYAYNAAVRAGAEVLNIYNNVDDLEVGLKNQKPITLADRKSHKLILEYLHPTRLPILSEEGRDLLYQERCGWDLFWLVDPLDGTLEFIKGNGEFTINIALVYNNKPVLGVIYVPYTRKMFFCDHQVGSFFNSEVTPSIEADYTIAEIYANAHKLPVFTEEHSPIRIAISRSHNTDETFAQIEKLKQLHPDCEIIEQGSSYKFCMLASGMVDYYVRTSNTMEWDTAAGELILTCAGGSTTPIGEGTPSCLEYNKADLQNPHFVCRSKFASTINSEK